MNTPINEFLSQLRKTEPCPPPVHEPDRIETTEEFETVERLLGRVRYEISNINLLKE